MAAVLVYLWTIDARRAAGGLGMEDDVGEIAKLVRAPRALYHHADVGSVRCFYYVNNANSHGYNVYLVQIVDAGERTLAVVAVVTVPRSFFPS